MMISVSKPIGAFNISPQLLPLVFASEIPGAYISSTAKRAYRHALKEQRKLSKSLRFLDPSKLDLPGYQKYLQEFPYEYQLRNNVILYHRVGDNEQHIFGWIMWGMKK